MTVIPLREQLLENTLLSVEESSVILPCLTGRTHAFRVRRGGEIVNPLVLNAGDDGLVRATGNYYVGIDWIKEGELAVQVSPKMNDGMEIDYVRMLNEALCEPENYEHLQDLITIRFDKPSIEVTQQQDLLSVFLITEFINLLHVIVRKGLKKSYYVVDDNLKSKVKGRILVGQNIHRNLVRGNITDNVCRYQVYDIDSDENRILKKALMFCIRQLKVYSNATDVSVLEKKTRYIKPYFDGVGDDVSVSSIKCYKGNPVYKDYYKAIKFAQLLLQRYSYDITSVGRQKVNTPPFWIDMSKLFELYIFSRLRRIFTVHGELRYHMKAHWQELDYLLNPKLWPEPYVIDAKYKPRYKESAGIYKDDARQVCGYARLTKIYEALDLDENKSLPLKCLIIYPDQDASEGFVFDRIVEPAFDRVDGYVRLYKVGIRLPEIHT